MRRSFVLALLSALYFGSALPSFAQTTDSEERTPPQAPATTDTPAQTEEPGKEEGPSTEYAIDEMMMAVCASAQGEDTAAQCTAAIDSGALNSFQVAEAQYRIAVAELFLEHFDASVERASLSIQANPDWPAPYLLRGTANREKENYTLAMADYEHVITMDKPETIAEAFTERATAHIKMGNVELALADLEEAQRRNPDHKRSRAYRKKLLQQLGRDKGVSQ